MTIQYTLSIIKPDATRRNITGKVNSYLEKVGLEIVAQKMLKLTKEQAENFYLEHKARPFFSSLIDYMISNRVVVQVLKGEDAVLKNREVMGATNPSDAMNGTIRKDFALTIEENTIHGSDSLESAKREIAFFFKNDEIFG
ncbi:MAG TPA: nucleoside-diphosphate kinase [Candidatus Megaira endosymbiont of Nemacystus decipiens]|nr:nucleoside-diphosphate kinase [Candidatus Megaera endosymbiont of Nemacystus decipiens]